MTVKTESCYRKDIVEVGKRLYARGLLEGGGGNLSIRISENEVLITPSGMCKGFLEPDQLVKIDLEGKVITALKEYAKPARDYRMHLALYQRRADIKAIVHSHPPVATGFAIAEYPLDEIAAPEVMFTFNQIAVTEYALPTTEEVPVVINKALDKYPAANAIILAKHGAITVGSEIWDAYYKMETLEAYLKSLVVAKVMGGFKPLNAEQIKKIEELMGVKH